MGYTLREWTKVDGLDVVDVQQVENGGKRHVRYEDHDGNFMTWNEDNKLVTEAEYDRS